MFSIQHSQRKRNELQEHYDLLSEQILRLRKAHAIEVDVAIRFKLEKQIEQAEAERAEILITLEELEAKIERLQTGIKEIKVGAEVFISYASRDHNRVLQIVDHLESAGVQVWVDHNEVRQTYGEKTVHAVKDCKVLMLMCSDASMRSLNVKQEIQLAWKYGRPCLPLLLEPSSFPEQTKYWLEGWRRIEVLTLPPEQWLPSVLWVLAHAGVQCHAPNLNPMPNGPVLQPTYLAQDLEGLRMAARFTDQIWPLPAGRVQRRSVTRGLGAPQDGVQHGYCVGSRVCLAIESDREGHLLLLNEGPEKIIYCLCPSWFAPLTRLRPGRSYLPQEHSPYDSFVITGKAGQEHLLAIITDEPLELGWMPADPQIPARVLTPADIETLLDQLCKLEGNQWVVLSTYFDVID